MNDTIQIFACDHRKLSKPWNIPFIRVGTGYNHDAAVKDSEGDNILKWDLELSEGTAMWWVYKHIAEFGDPSYVGFCHYRRFFSLAARMPIINVTEESLKPEWILTPFTQMTLMKQEKASGITHVAFQDFDPSTFPYKYVWEQLKHQSDLYNWGFELDLCKKAFDLLLDHAAEAEVPHLVKSFENKPIYHCNVFTLERRLFDRMNELIWPVIFDLFRYVEDNKVANLHPRYMGYILERLTSCIFYMFEYQGEKILHLPLLCATVGKETPIRERD